MDFYFDGIDWIEGQQKTTVNQPPLFDIFDENNISFGNSDVYVGTSFTGTKLFAYGLGIGSDDPVLGFPLQYSSIDNVGDISFDVSLNSYLRQYLESCRHYPDSGRNFSYSVLLQSPGFPDPGSTGSVSCSSCLR